MKRKTVLIIVLFINLLILSAQKPPMKYGKVDKADLEMTVYPADSSASAVVLCNYGYFDSEKFQFVHQMRIKVLKEEGKSRANFFVPASEKATVKGQTINLENGVPVITKLEKSSIFIEKITTDHYQVRVALPNVKVGSVFDVEFFYNGLPNYWTFQEIIPVRWSELNIEKNQYVSFRKNQIGYIPFAVSTEDRWITKDVPAFKSEPYINNLKNYMSRFDIEVSAIHIAGEYYKEYATTWEAVVNTLNKSKDFGLELKTIHLYLNGIARQISTETNVPEDRLNKAFQLIKNIKWNHESSIWANNIGLNWSYNKGIGNVSDINLNLILLLQKLDIDAKPVVLCTRENGVLPTYSVSFNKLNYVVVQATIGDKKYLLDATEEYLPVGMLPERTINGRGLLVLEDSFLWIDLNPAKKDKSYTFTTLILNADGIMKGKWTKINSDYAAMNARKNYKTFNNQDDYLKSIETENKGLSIENYTVTDFDSIQKPVKEDFSVILKNRVTKTNNQLFVKSMPFDDLTENPFKLEERLYPVDFVKPIEKTQLFSLEIPEGYQVDQLPKNIKITLPENTANFQMLYSSTGRIIQVLYKFNINKPVFYITEYKDLKIFFDEVVKKQSEMLIIKKAESNE